MNIERETSTWLTVNKPFSKIDPPELLRWFLEPAKIAQWWAAEAEVEPVPGRKWHLRFPQMQTVLMGEIAEITPTRLTASWVFTHEPELPPRMVTITTEPTQGGSLLRILQGPYRQGDQFLHEDQDRASHIEGWAHFLTQLTMAIGAQTNVNA